MRIGVVLGDMGGAYLSPRCSSQAGPLPQCLRTPSKFTRLAYVLARIPARLTAMHAGETAARLSHCTDPENIRAQKRLAMPE